VTVVVNPHLLEEVRELGEFEASACMNCGGCTAVCPLGIDVLPRQLFRHVLLGMDDQLEQDAEAVYSCLLCRMCEVTCCCAEQTHITENVRSLRHYLNRRLYGIGEAG
jgi:heterodisulfide reductase subunit C